jgi:pimeloyl-ACP methyl ester carboxylesterase
MLDFRTPDPMPSEADVAAKSDIGGKRYLVTGSRADTRSENAEPDFKYHGIYDTVGSDLAPAEGKHAVVYVHGYNVTTAAALTSARKAFNMLQTSLIMKSRPFGDYAFVLFTWPGDAGTLGFNKAQKYAQVSGEALYGLVTDLCGRYGAATVSLVAHSLGAHVALRSASILAQRLIKGTTTARYRSVLLLSGAVQNDVFQGSGAYHFADAPYAMADLSIFHSSDDGVLRFAYRASERDKALGYRGLQSTAPLERMRTRVPEKLGSDSAFDFRQFNCGRQSNVAQDPDLLVGDHSDYWNTPAKTDRYVALLP